MEDELAAFAGSARPDRCPVEVAMAMLGRKWTIHIIRDLIRGNHRFSDFLETNPGLSTKVLSQRLKELQADDFVEKRIVSATPLRIEYHLTAKGRSLDRVIVELSLFSIDHATDQVFIEPPANLEPVRIEARRRFTAPPIATE